MVELDCRYALAFPKGATDSLGARHSRVYLTEEDAVSAATDILAMRPSIGVVVLLGPMKAIRLKGSPVKVVSVSEDEEVMADIGLAGVK